MMVDNIPHKAMLCLLWVIEKKTYRDCCMLSIMSTGCLGIPLTKGKTGEFWYSWLKVLNRHTNLDWGRIGGPTNGTYNKAKWKLLIQIAWPQYPTNSHNHVDVIKWKHFLHKGQWRGTLMFSLICAWMNGWVNNRVAGELRCHGAHYDVIAMSRYLIVKLISSLSGCSSVTLRLVVINNGGALTIRS